jgi:3-hydroxyisobutyrate dehydrogenase
MSRSPTTTVAVLGTGVMGSAMARNAVRAGLSVRAWSLPLQDAQRLSADGIAVAPTAAAAAAGADLVVTAVPDAPAIESFSSGPDGFLDAMDPAAVWIQTSTVGAAAADRLIAMAARQGRTIVDAPLLGSRDPAERGELVILASGDSEAIARCTPFFDAVARRVMVVGPTGSGSRLKLVTNGWIMSAVASIAEAFALAEGLGLDGRLFLEAIGGTAMDMGYAQIKGEMMLRRHYPVQMTLANAVKDAELALAAAREQGLPAGVIAAAAELMASAADQGWADHDMAAAFNAARTLPRNPNEPEEPIP